MALSQGQVINNRYRIVKLLGQGGFGAVYRAYDLTLKNPCAVKENLELSAESQRQFQQEAIILAGLRHPNLPRVYDHFVIPDQGQYLVMDYVEGDDLQTILDRSGGPLPEAQVLPWISQVLDALAYLHRQPQPVIHRDIKPANIKITPEGQAMLVDFGIAKMYDPGMKTTVGARAITPGYSPPEQYGMGTTDARTDIYALGATLYTLLTNNQPIESVRRAAGDMLLPVHQLNSQVSQQISKSVLQAMALNPAQRFQSASEFKNALTRPVAAVAAQQPPYAFPAQATIQAPSSSSPYQATQLAPSPVPYPASGAIPVAAPQPKRTNKVLLVIGIGLVLLVCVGLAFGLGSFLFSPDKISSEDIDATNDAERQISSTQRALRQTSTALALQLSSGQLTADAGAQATQQAERNQLAVQTKQASITQEANATRSAPAYIPSLQAWPTGLLFFESGYDGIEYDQRVYDTRFDHKTARFINWELSLEREREGTYVAFTIKAIYYNPDGSVFAEQTFDTYFDTSWKSSHHSMGYGWEEPGNYPLGTYLVEIYIADQMVISDSFTIY